MNLKVSVVIPYFNSYSTLFRALESVRMQTYKHLEVVLIDDGSTDDSYHLVSDYIDNHLQIPFHHLRQSNKGPASARNRGVAHASGEFIAFLDSDDSWEPRKLEIQIGIISNYSADLVSCNSNVITPHHISRKYYSRKLVKKINYRCALLKYYTSTPCVIVRKSAIIDVGGFPEDMRVGEDMVVFYRIIRRFNSYVSGQFLTNIHKDLYGQSGLTANMRIGYVAILESIWIAKREDSISQNRIGFALFFVALLFAFLNYYKRLAFVYIGRIRQILHNI